MSKTHLRRSIHTNWRARGEKRRWVWPVTGMQVVESFCEVYGAASNHRQGAAELALNMVKWDADLRVFREIGAQLPPFCS